MALLASHHHHSGPNLRAVIWVLLLTELRGRDFPPNTLMSPVGMFLLVLHTPVLVTCCRHYINLAIYSIIDLNILLHASDVL